LISVRGCAWPLLGYVFGHCVNGSGGGSSLSGLKQCANLDANGLVEGVGAPLVSPLESI
jgi:hypothetical protein